MSDGCVEPPPVDELVSSVFDDVVVDWGELVMVDVGVVSAGAVDEDK